MQVSFRKPKVKAAFPAGADFFDRTKKSTVSLDLSPKTPIERSNSQPALLEKDLIQSNRAIQMNKIIGLSSKNGGLSKRFESMEDLRITQLQIKSVKSSHEQGRFIAKSTKDLR